jgi:hypothetical protein
MFQFLKQKIFIRECVIKTNFPLFNIDLLIKYTILNFRFLKN